MRGRDENSGDFHAPSRSTQRRAALDVLALSERLSVMSDAQLGSLPLPLSLLPHIQEARRISAHGARKRQLAYLAKLLRREDDEVLDALRDALNAGGEAARRETAQLHLVEHWRERLLEDGDTALSELLDAYPASDHQRLRQLLRNAQVERKGNKPPHAMRELFRVLRELLAPSEAATHNHE